MESFPGNKQGRKKSIKIRIPCNVFLANVRVDEECVKDFDIDAFVERVPTIVVSHFESEEEKAVQLDVRKDASKLVHFGS